jgi:hypothetical protein
LGLAVLGSLRAKNGTNHKVLSICGNPAPAFV